jgi:hypothetical protein
VSQALLYAQEELGQRFPTLSWAEWANALQEAQPDLWVEQHTTHLNGDDLAHLAQRLAAAPRVPDMDSLLHGSRARYLAKRLVNYQNEAVEVLAHIEADPEAYSLPIYRLVTGLALGNAVADEVFQATHRGPHPEPARAAVHERLQALRHARGEFG